MDERAEEIGDQRPRGLYRPSEEHDACGVGFVAHIKGTRSHSIVRSALDLLINLEHRGATGSDPDTGDGAGILVQMPDRFLRKIVHVALPESGAYGAGLVFLPHDEDARQSCKSIVERIVVEEGQRLLGWRDVPVGLDKVGKTAASAAPRFEQLFIGDQGSRGRGSGVRASPLHHSQAHRARGEGSLHLQPVVEDADLQGHADGDADRRHVPGSV